MRASARPHKQSWDAAAARLPRPGFFLVYIVLCPALPDRVKNRIKKVRISRKKPPVRASLNGGNLFPLPVAIQLSVSIWCFLSFISMPDYVRINARVFYAQGGDYDD